MRKLVLLTGAVVSLMACEHIELASSDNGQQQTDEVTKRFTFTVKGDFANPEFSTRTNTYMTADGVEMTDLWVVDYVVPSGDAEGTVAGKVVQMLHQTKDDAGWGAPTMSLTLGTHHVLFLASRGQGAQYADGVVTWTKPMDTFYKDYEVTVVKTSNGNRAVTLDRVATKLSLVVEDAIPEGTTGFVITPTAWYNGWNMLTGESVAAEDYSLLFNIPQAYVGHTNTSFLMWGLSGTDEWQTNIGIESKAGEDVNASAVITDAPFKANRTTKYSGKLYSNASESSVSLNATWLQDYEGVY